MDTEVMTCDIKIPVLVKIDTALAQYYKDCGRNDYLNENGKGKFRVFVDAMDFDDIIIRKQLEGDIKQAENCKLVAFDKNFPFPLNTEIKSKSQKIIEIFKILQNCYLFGTSQPVIDYDDDKYNDSDSDSDDCEQEACPLAKEGPDVSKSAIRQVATRNKYLYYSASRGLMYGGVCFNKKCKAFNQPITVGKGFGKFSPLEDQTFEDYGCPGCGAFFMLENLFLYKCNAKITWKKENKDTITKKKYSVDGNDYVEFGVEIEAGVFKKSKKVKFEALRFEVTEIMKNKK